MASSTNWSSATQEAIQHLRSLKTKNDGWFVEMKQLINTNNPSVGVRLLRRNIPVTASYFMDLQYDRPSNSIVGLLSLEPSDGNRVQAQVFSGM